MGIKILSFFHHTVALSVANHLQIFKNCPQILSPITTEHLKLLKPLAKKYLIQNELKQNQMRGMTKSFASVV